jgi:D-proline reductase (dithiol) PrdB
VGAIRHAAARRDDRAGEFGRPVPLKDEQAPFDEAGERARPDWGDPTWRPIPNTTGPDRFGMMHLHVNNANVLEDPEIALPIQRLNELVEDGVVGGAAATHASVMGYQADDLEGWRTNTAPELVELFRRERVDGVIFAPA